MHEQLPPQNLDAVRSVLGSMIRENNCIAEVILTLRAEDFYLASHQKLFAAIAGMFDAGKPVDLVTLADELVRREQWDDVGGGGYLARLWESAPTAANYQHYAGIVRERSLLRCLIHAGNEILHSAYFPTGPAKEVLDEAERRILSVSEMGVVGQSCTLQSVLSESLARIDERSVKKGGNGVPTGFVDIDKKMCGLQNGELILLAARPSQGKTALCLSIIRHVITKARLPVLFVSLEQSRVEIGERLLCAGSGIDGQRLRNGDLTDNEMDAIGNASEELNRGGLLYVDDTACQTVARIAANARRHQRLHGIRLLCIDYLQLIEPDNPRASEYERLSNISRRLKLMARDLGVPLLCLAQLNREVEGRSSGRPKLSDLRGSGSLEQDSDVVLLLHKTESQGNVDVVNVLIEKQRNGPTGEVPLAFCKPTVSFQSYAFGENPYA